MPGSDRKDEPGYRKEERGWWNLSTASDHVEIVMKCGEEVAVGLLRLAIAEGKIEVKWGDDQLQHPSEPMYDSKEPPTNYYWWLRANIRADANLVFEVRDDWCLAYFYKIPGVVDKFLKQKFQEIWNSNRWRFGDESKIRFRPLSVSKAKVMKIWPRDDTAPPLRRNYGAARASDEQVRTALRAIYEDGNRPNMNQAWRIIDRLKLKATRQQVFRILREPEFPAIGSRRAFREGVIVEALNPKTAAFFLAFIPQFVEPAGSVAFQFIVLGFVSVVLNTLADIVVAFAASRIRNGATARPALIRRLREASGAAMVLLGVGLALAKRPAN